MSFTLLPYTVLTAGASTDLDMTAATDAEISQRNGHYILTEPYRMIIASLHGATITRANIQIPTWNAIGRFNVWPPNRSLTMPSPPQFDSYIMAPPKIPQNEEITIKVTTTGAAEQDTAFLWIAPDDWSQNITPGRLVINVRVTAAVTIVANAWSAVAALTFEQSLRGGVYAVLGAHGQCTNGSVFRLIFPRNKLYHGRRLRPGWFFSNALGDIVPIVGPESHLFLGEFGRFHTFEPPQIEVWGTTAGAQTAELRLYLQFISDTPAPSELLY